MNSFQLKVWACIFMVVDHIAEFLPGMPVWMHWIGRLSAPIFFFLIGWSCVYTSNRRRLLLRLYLASVGMSLIQALSEASMMPIDNNIFATLFQVSLIVCLLSAPTRRERLRNLALYVLAQCVISAVVYLLFGPLDDFAYGFAIEDVLTSASGSVLGIEGGLFDIILGVVLWKVHDSKPKLIAAFGAMTFVHLFLTATPVLSTMINRLAVMTPDPGLAVTKINFIVDTFGISPFVLGQSPISVNYQWMMIFALPFMLLYNHRRGPHVKWFFYAFYPAHIVILFLIGMAMSNHMLF